jgi:hypothetical protein
MNLAIRVKATAFGFAVVIAGGCASSGANGVIEPCSLLTTNEAQAITGVDIESARVTGTNDGCSYATRRDGDIVSALLIEVHDENASQDFETSRKIAESNATVEDISDTDLGADNTTGFTFSSGTGSGTVVSAEGLQGDTRTRVLVQGSKADTTAAIEALNRAMDRLTTPRES